MDSMTSLHRGTLTFITFMSRRPSEDENDVREPLTVSEITYPQEVTLLLVVQAERGQGLACASVNRECETLTPRDLGTCQWKEQSTYTAV
jgi:hypothetical protein